MCFPRYRLFTSIKYSFLELFRYKPADNKRNGVVGKPGTKIPSIPKKREIVPSIMNKTLSMKLLRIIISTGENRANYIDKKVLGNRNKWSKQSINSQI